jgi:hypothetical protein
VHCGRADAPIWPFRRHTNFGFLATPAATRVSFEPGASMASPGGNHSTWQFHVDLNALRVNELKAGCRSYGLPVSGLKDQLVGRLLEYYHANENRAQGTSIRQWLYNCPVHLKKRESNVLAASRAPSSSASSGEASAHVSTRPLPTPAPPAGTAYACRGPLAVKEAQASCRRPPIPVCVLGLCAFSY